MLQPLPAGLGELGVRVLETGRGGDLTVLERGRVAVALHVQRRHHPLVELGAFLQHGGGRVQARILKAGNLRDVVDARQVLDGKQHVLDGGGIAHGNGYGWMEMGGEKKGIARDAPVRWRALRAR